MKSELTVDKQRVSDGKTGVYLIENKIDKKVYIGSSLNIKRRFKEHISALKNNKHCNQHLQSAWKKYGNDSFLFRIIEETTKEEMREREQYWVYHYLAIKKRREVYNTYVSVGFWLGQKHNENSKEKISQNHADFSGENHPRTKLTWALVKQIREKYLKGEEYRSLSEQYGVSVGCISHIVRGTSWKDEEYKVPETKIKTESHHMSKLNWTQVKEIRDLHSKGKKSYKKLSKEYGVSLRNIACIIKNITWKEDP